jgi:hypothetical protein
MVFSDFLPNLTLSTCSAFVGGSAKSGDIEVDPKVRPVEG